MVHEDWYDLSARGGVRQLSREDEARSPFKTTVSPLRLLTSIGSNPMAIHPDPAHTYAINGWGKDLAASSLITLCYLGIFAGSLDDALDQAYSQFRDYCRAFSKTTSIVAFHLKALKVKSLHGSNIHYACLGGTVGAGLSSYRVVLACMVVIHLYS